MKKSLLSVLLGIAAFTPAMAQMIVPASGPNEWQATIFNDYGFPNSYTIDYTPFCSSSACAGTRKQLTAMVSDDGTTARLMVDDQTMPPNTPWPKVVLASGGNSAPDVVIGNDFSNPGWYIAGVTAVSGGYVTLTLYSIQNVGVGGGTLSIVGPTATYTVSTAAPNAVPPAHIDIAASTANPYMGYANANQLVITWRDVANGIMAYSSQLNGAGGIINIINNNTNLSNPDVAYVERNAAGLKVAEFSYFDLTSATNQKLFYSEWQTVPYVVPGPATLYDNTKTYYNPFPGRVSVGRIDGIDNYNLNNAGSGNATFCIAAAAAVTTGQAIFEYNSITGPFVATNMTSPVTVPANGLFKNTNEIPCVTSGPGNYYTVGFYSNPPSSSGGAKQMYYAMAVDWNTGLLTTTNNAYEIMSGSYDPMYLPGICVSGTCNTNAMGVQDLFAGFDNYAFLWYKYSIPVPYAFKHASEATIVAATTSEWQIFPNPASDNVTLIAPDGFNTKTSASYNITDMSGKTLQTNAVNATSQQIDISKVPAGTYMLNIQADAKAVKTIKFVKE